MSVCVRREKGRTEREEMRKREGGRELTGKKERELTRKRGNERTRKRANESERNPY